MDLAIPPLAPRYETALRAAVDHIFANFTPFAVVASGSILRGNPDPGSDLDLLVLHHEGWRRRVQLFFHGVPAEIFVNSPAWIDTYLAEEEAAGEPVMAHMLATGFVVYTASALTEELMAKARASLARGPKFSELALRQRRYSAACLFEDALEIAHRDRSSAALILGRALHAAVGYWFASRQQFTVRSKGRIEVIRREDPATAELLDRVLLADSLEERMVAARRLAATVLGHTGFFEWDSGPSEMA